MSTILLKRRGALGDVLLTTPIVQRLVKDEGRDVYVQTVRQDVYKNNPYVKGVLGWHEKMSPDTEVLDLELAYERKPKGHIIDAYSLKVFGDRATPHTPELFCTGIDYIQAKDALGEFFYHPYIVVHMGVGWENRTMPESFWHNLIAQLMISHKDKKLVFVGNNDDRQQQTENHLVDLRGLLHLIDLHGKLSIHALTEVVRNAKLFIGPDSGILHVAQTTPTPCVGIFTCAKAEYRVTSKRCVPVTPVGLDCYGCLHEVKPPVVYVGCPKNRNFACVNEFVTPKMVLEACYDALNLALPA